MQTKSVGAKTNGLTFATGKVSFTPGLAPAGCTPAGLSSCLESADSGQGSGCLVTTEQGF